MVETEPLLATIAIPTFNRAMLLQRAVASALAQDYRSLEILIVDNASDDTTEEVCHGLIARDPRIRYLRHPSNLGPVRNFEIGLEQARGHYFMWLADDDWITPNYVQCCIEELNRGSHILVVGGNSWDSDHGASPELAISALEPDPVVRILTYLRVVTSNVAVYGIARTHVLRKQLPFPKQIGGDFEWMVRLLSIGTLSVAPEAHLYRSFACGASRNLPLLASDLGQGAIAQKFPRVAIAVGVAAGLAFDTRVRVFRSQATRLRCAVLAGAIMWVRMGSTADLTNSARTALQKSVPEVPYAVLKAAYRPARRLQARLRSSITDV